MRLIAIILLSFVFAVDYESEIQPIFENNCGNCHLSNSSGGLNLSSYENLMDGSDDGEVVIPGDHASSVLYDRITRENSEQGDMPPGNFELSQLDIDLIAQWIDEGALPEESSDNIGCTDPNAITCEEINSYPSCEILNYSECRENDYCHYLNNECSGPDIYNYFPFCDSCIDGIPCENYYNPNSTVDNGMCMYIDTPDDDELIIEYIDDYPIECEDIEEEGCSASGYYFDWSSFSPPVDISQYVLQFNTSYEYADELYEDGEHEYMTCIMLIEPNTQYLGTNYFYEQVNNVHSEIVLWVDYPNNIWWGSARGTYYYSLSCSIGDIYQDGLINVIDIVVLINYILEGDELTANQLCFADINEDGIVNVIDIVNLANIILHA